MTIQPSHQAWAERGLPGSPPAMTTNGDDLALKWGLSPLDVQEHLINEDGDHPTGVFKALCGHWLFEATALRSIPECQCCKACLVHYRTRGGSVFTVLGVLSAVGVWVLKAAPLGWVIAAVWEGRDRSPGAGFLLHPHRDDPDPWIDERMITTALASLNIAPLTRFFKDGGKLIYTIAARRDGQGTAAQVRMPLGTKASDVVARTELLAANLGRLEVETWPAVGPQANVLDLWIADPGALDGPAPPWPLLHHGTVDVTPGCPGE